MNRPVLTTLLVVLASPVSHAAVGATPTESLTPAHSYGELPLRFEPNVGQSDAAVRFLSRGPGYTLFLTQAEAVLTLTRTEKNGTGPRAGVKLEHTDIVRTRLVGARHDARLAGRDELPGRSNYFIGNDPRRWRTGVRQYERVDYRGVYPGVDLTYYGSQGQLEYDFVVAPGADPGAVRLRVEGARGLRLDGDGNLVLKLSAGELVQQAPVLYQEHGGMRVPVAGGYVLRGKSEVGFRVAAYDRSRTLTIDPVLRYSTYLGGTSNDVGYGIAVDQTGAAYVTGLTSSLDFPHGGAPYQGAGDVFVTKLDPTGRTLVYSTFLGAGAEDWGLGVSVDATGNAVVVGWTYSALFPVVNAVQGVYRGNGDAFVARLRNDGAALLYSTFLGGTGDDLATGIAVDPQSGEASVTGTTSSVDFPVARPLQGANAGGRDSFLSRLSADGSQLVYSSYLGGAGDDWADSVALAPATTGLAHHAWIAGTTDSVNFPVSIGPGLRGDHDAFVAHFDVVTPNRIFVTFVGGDGTEFGDGLAVDDVFNSYLTGGTTSADLPAGTNQPHGDVDAFVTKLDPWGRPIYSTYHGGSGWDGGRSVAVDGAGRVWVAGGTTSNDYVVSDARYRRGLGLDAFVARFDPAGGETMALLLGGNDDDEAKSLALDTAGNPYLAGFSMSADFPKASALQGLPASHLDAFVTKLLPRTRGDVDRSGTADIVWHNAVSGQLALWTLNFNPPFAPASPGKNSFGYGWLGPDERIAAILDVSGDERAEPLKRNLVTGENAVLYLGLWWSALPPMALNWSIVGSGDFNGDGYDDLLWRDANTGQNQMWLMRGTTVWADQMTNSIPVLWSCAGVGDLNGDGKADIVWRQSQTAMVVAWLMNGSTRLGGPVIGNNPDVTWQIAGVGDVDGDSRADIVWRNTAGGWNSVWFMDGPTVKSNPLIGSAPDLQWKIALVGDLNGDGRADLLWRHAVWGLDYFWLMDGPNTIASGDLWQVPPAQGWEVVPLR